MTRRPTPKTGLAARMRAWMSGRGRPYTYAELYLGLGDTEGKTRARIRSAMDNFELRGEVDRTPDGRWRYNNAWRPATRASSRIYRAMYITPVWSVNDIMRLTDLSDKSYVYRIMTGLRAAEVIEQVGVRSMSPRPGCEYVYRVRNRERFRWEYVR